MDNNNAQFSQMNTGGTALFLKQPPKIMGLNSYFMEPSNIGGTTGTGDGGEYTPILREVYNLRTATQSSLLQFQNNTLNTMEDLQHEVIEIRKSVADINKILNKSIKQQEKFQEEQFKRQKLADRYQKQLDNQNRKYKFSTPSMSKSIARGTGNVASDIVGGLLDTLLPGFSRAGGTKLIMKGIKAGTTGLIGLLFGTKTSDKVQKQVTTSLGDTIGLSPSSKGKKTNISGLFKNMSKLFSGKKGGRTITADVLDEAGNVVGKTTATVQSKKVGFIGRMFGQASNYTKNLFKSFNKNMITKPSTALNVSVKTAGTGLIRSVGNIGKSMTSIATKGMGMAMAGLGRAIATAGAGLISALSNPLVLGTVLAVALGVVGWNLGKDKENHPILNKVFHPFGLGMGDKNDSTQNQKLSLGDKLTGGHKSKNTPKGMGVNSVGRYGTIAQKGRAMVLDEAEKQAVLSDPKIARYIDYLDYLQGKAPITSSLNTDRTVTLKSGKVQRRAHLGTDFGFTSGTKLLGIGAEKGVLRTEKYTGGNATYGNYLTYGSNQAMLRLAHLQGYDPKTNTVTTGATGGVSPHLHAEVKTIIDTEGGKKTYYIGFDKQGNKVVMIEDPTLVSMADKTKGLAEAVVDKFYQAPQATDMTRETLRHGKLTPDEALDMAEKLAGGYKSTASGWNEHRGQTWAQEFQDKIFEKYGRDPKYAYKPTEFETQILTPNQNTTPQIQIKDDNSPNIPGINMTVFELMQGLFQQ